MGKVGLIATNEEMYEYAEKFRQGLDDPSELVLYSASMNEAVNLISRLDEEEIDIVICRGSSVEALLKAGIEIPVIDMPLTAEEIMHAVNKAKKITQKQNPKIAFLGYRKGYRQFKAYLSAMNIDTVHYPIGDESEYAKALEKIRNKIDVVIAGRTGLYYAKKSGVKCVYIGSSMDSITSAYNLALKTQESILKEKKIAVERSVLINSISEIIVNLNRNRAIVLFNVAAENAFQKRASDVMGKNIFDIFATLNAQLVDDVFATGIQKTGILMEATEKKFVLNLNPIKVNDQVENVIITMQETNELQKIETKVRQALYLKGNIAQYTFENIIGTSEKIKRTIRIAKNFSRTHSNVLILGETGTGKEMFAQSIHNASDRRNGPFVAINCGAIPDALLESELFGYVDGAFTGAKKGGKMGFFELAHNGTIFLDEISEMGLPAQVNLLRVLQEKQVRRIGSNKIISVDVRVVAASNVPLNRLVLKNKFRKDLFYRLCVLVLNIPALRDRQKDIASLTAYFIKEYNKVFGRNIHLTKNAVQAMQSFNWEGNIRQLQSFCERIVVIALNEEIDRQFILNEIENSYYFLDNKKDLLEGLHSHDENNKTNSKDAIVIKGEVWDRKSIETILRKKNGNKSELAKALGVSRTTMWKKLKYLNL